MPYNPSTTRPNGLSPCWRSKKTYPYSHYQYKYIYIYICINIIQTVPRAHAYLVGDLGPSGRFLVVFGVDQGQAKREDDEEGEQDIPEPHIAFL